MLPSEIGQKKRYSNSWLIYPKHKKLVKQSVKCSLRRHMHKAIDTGCNTMRELWNKLKRFGLVKDKNKNHELTLSLDDLLDAFTHDHVPVSPIIQATSLYYRYNPLSFPNKFYFKDITHCEVLQAIRSLASTAIGEYSISIKMNRTLSDLLCHIHMHVYIVHYNHSHFQMFRNEE
jgi:hypothetical protein